MPGSGKIKDKGCSEDVSAMGRTRIWRAGGGIGNITEGGQRSRMAVVSAWCSGRRVEGLLPLSLSLLVENRVLVVKGG